MSDPAARTSIVSESKALGRYRTLLMLGILANFVLVARIPYARLRAVSAHERRNAAPAHSASSTPDTPILARSRKSPGQPTRGSQPNAPLTTSPTTKAGAVEPSAGEVVVFAVTPPSVYLMSKSPSTKMQLPPAKAPRVATVPLHGPARRPSSEYGPSLRQLVNTMGQSLPGVQNYSRRFITQAQQAWNSAYSMPIRRMDASRWEALLAMLQRAQIIQPPAATSRAQDAAPAVSSTARKPSTSVESTAMLVFANPVENGGPVHYLLDNTVHTLAPGEFHKVTTGARHRVRFDRGGGLGVVDMTVDGGEYIFDVSDQGWSLAPARAAIEF